MSITNFDNIERAMAFAAHPDDEILICGGLLHRLSSAGKEVCVVSFTLGGTAANSPEESRRMEDQRREEIEKADEILGVSRREILEVPSQQVYNAVYRDNELHHRLIELIRSFRPQVLISHQGDDHRDHNAIRTITPESVYQASEAILGHLGDPWETPLVLYGSPIGQVREPSVIVEIGEADLQAKVQSLRAQVSQTRKGFLQRLEEITRSSAALWGARSCGPGRYAEAFHLDSGHPLRIPMNK